MSKNRMPQRRARTTVLSASIPNSMFNLVEDLAFKLGVSRTHIVKKALSDLLNDTKSLEALKKSIAIAA